MGYDEDDSKVRVDLFKKSGKWYTTLSIEWHTWGGSLDRGGKLIHDAFREALQADPYTKTMGDGDMFAVCLDPYHEFSHPVIVWKW